MCVHTCHRKKPLKGISFPGLDILSIGHYPLVEMTMDKLQRRALEARDDEQLLEDFLGNHQRYNFGLHQVCDSFPIPETLFPM